MYSNCTDKYGPSDAREKLRGIAESETIFVTSKLVTNNFCSFVSMLSEI